jgi:diketogulonate reductase-like aldo/keto reductase
MLCKELGKTGVQLPEIGIGTWHYHAGPEPVRKGLDAGALFIDTAESYGSEPVVGEAIASRRDQLFLATKVSPQNYRRADVLKAADGSLSRLRTDRIDLYQLHYPSDSIPMEETLGAMEELVDAGKVRFIGVSNFSLVQLQQAQRAMRKHPIVSNQMRYNLIDRTINDGLLAYCQANQITLIASSPLARGFELMRDCDTRGVLTSLAGATGHTPVQVALNWCLSQPGVVVIPKGNSESHVRENCGASDWRLTPEQMRELDQSVVFRRRSGLEQFLRRHLPPVCKEAVKRLLQFSPRALRRKIN